MENLPEILRKHGEWLRSNTGGERADLQGADLRGADLSRANLFRANLRGADLSDVVMRNTNLCDANLSYAYLGGANLSGANLRSANLQDTNLHDANLSGASLRGAFLQAANLNGADLSDAALDGTDLTGITSLWGTIGNMREIKTVMCDGWTVTYTADRLQIGCQLHSLSDWWAFTDDEISRMDSKALAWWRIWKPILRIILVASPAVRTEGA